MQTQPINKNDWRFPVVLGDVFTATGVKVPKVKAVVRTDIDAPIAAVSDRYRLFTHTQVQDTLKPFIDKLGTPISNYFVERNGARLIAEHTFRNHTLDVPPHTRMREVGDKIALRINVVNSYNASTSLEIKLGAMVLSCLNGMTVFDSLFDLRFKHLGDDWALELPKPDLVMTAFQQAGETWKTWAYIPVDAQKKRNIIQHSTDIQLLPKKHYAQEEWRFQQSETVWDLYNAYTFVMTHSSARMQQSGRIGRYGRLNAMFEHEFGEKQVA